MKYTYKVLQAVAIKPMIVRFVIEESVAIIPTGRYEIAIDMNNIVEFDGDVPQIKWSKLQSELTYQIMLLRTTKQVANVVTGFQLEIDI